MNDKTDKIAWDSLPSDFFYTFVPIMKQYSMNKILLLIGICFVGILSSCTTVGVLRYDRLQAAEVNFPEQIKTVGVVNYTPSSSVEVKDEHTDGILRGDGKVTAEAFANAIAGTDYFETVVLCDSLPGQNRTSTIEENMSPMLADSLIRTLGVDLLFSVERVFIELKENSYLIPGTVAAIPIIDCITTPVVKAYVSGRSTPLFTVSKSDSISWEWNSSLNVKDIVKESSEFAATIPVKYLVPYWEQVERDYFNGGNVDMRDAGVYVQENNWEEAKALWLKIYEQKKGASRMRAAYNLALYYEWSGDYTKAKEYVKEAIPLAKEGSAEKGMMEIYLLQLEAEAVKNRQLQIQMRRFQDIF